MSVGSVCVAAAVLVQFHRLICISFDTPMIDLYYKRLDLVESENRYSQGGLTVTL